MTDKITGARRYARINAALMNYVGPSLNTWGYIIHMINAVMAQNPVDEAEAIAIYDALDGARKGGAK